MKMLSVPTASAACLLAALLPCLALSQTQRPPATVAEQYLQSAADQERATEGLPPLKRDPALVAAAHDHALKMVANHEISHQFAGEPELATRAGDDGARFSKVSENVAEGPTPMEIQSAWMHSPGHRRNILDRDVDSVGIAVVSSGGQLYAVEDFERTVATLSLTQQESAVAALITPSGVQILPANSQAHADARATCATESGFTPSSAASHKPYFIMRFSAAELNRLPAALQAKLAAGQLHHAAVGACPAPGNGTFTSYNIAVLLYP